VQEIFSSCLLPRKYIASFSFLNTKDIKESSFIPLIPDRIAFKIQEVGDKMLSFDQNIDETNEVSASPYFFFA
jgi:hypothetical protein